MKKLKPVRRQHSAAAIVRRTVAGLLQTKSTRERLVSFGVSCGLHVVLLLVLSLIAIGTGAVPDPMLLIAAPSVGDEESTVAPDPDWRMEPELPTAPTDERPLEFALTNLEVSAASLTSVSMLESTATPADSSSTASAKSVSGNAGGNQLEGMQALAAAGIQARVNKAGGKRGEVQFALAWRNVNDLDIHVIAPSGEHISHQHRRSQCGGLLDVDMNVDGESEEPVENVRWLRHAPWGRYTVLINFFKLNSEGTRRPRSRTAYQLLAELGKDSQIKDAVAGFGELQVTVYRFHYVPDTFSSLQREQKLKQLDDLQAREEALATPLLEQARAAQGPPRQKLLQSIVQLYPHTDAAIQALLMIGGEVVKRPTSSEPK